MKLNYYQSIQNKDNIQNKEIRLKTKKHFIQNKGNLFNLKAEPGPTLPLLPPHLLFSKSIFICLIK